MAWVGLRNTASSATSVSAASISLRKVSSPASSNEKISGAKLHDELLDHDAAFEPGQRRADAGVRSLAESDVRRRVRPVEPHVRAVALVSLKDDELRSGTSELRNWGG